MSEFGQSRPDARSSQLSFFLFVLAGLIWCVGWLVLKLSKFINFSLWQTVAGCALFLVAGGLFKLSQRLKGSK